MKIEMYTKIHCPFCVSAKQLLAIKGVKDIIEINIQQDPSKLPEMLERSNNRRTVPQIFINNIHVGGFDDLKALDDKGELDKMLK